MSVSLVQAKLDKEKAPGLIAGPYQKPPLSNMGFIPLFLVPRKDPGEFRFIYDLSFPKNFFLNSHVDPEFSAVSFEMLAFT